ncbi:uncharacterized protein A1O9_04002 [Exophiala aquamarina CBS 119918]|uniref:Xylanolytic transcriptional activator regulatory domain-containing protein n=1 Tax=Exophiala aquamarina CBS 119918 TaxID=1182545 RepID=A0A072PIL3_9EURO|nr:uncharacterized protein A1O9_04002 [Exophiala aquamarina CBS 119918]KEF59158.1 hypothetical protein A1O9_04002 [Exophiala aquamarina CBS 119918]
MPYYDSAWYALRNVVYATGCRIYRSQSPTANFAEVESEARAYFANAMSVHSELLLTKPSLRSVRALLAMVIFAEGLASPALSSGLILNAALLAHSLGLHLKTADFASHADAEALQRCWLFWAVYCCEKHIAQRCGRPSVINDDEITCEVPRAVHPGSAIELEMLTYIIQTCQLYDQTSEPLLSTRALHEPAEKMLSLVARFGDQLQSWKASLPVDLQPADFLKQFRMPDSMRAMGLMVTHCSFYDLVIGVHSIFLYPWVIDSFAGTMDANLALMVREQVKNSSQQVANAARSLIVIARSLDMGQAGTQS